MSGDGTVLHYGIVRTAGQDIAIAASELIEAVDMPEQLLPLPEPSLLMAGMFLLRGQLIPVLDLHRLMAPAGAEPVLPLNDLAAETSQRAARQVAVVAYGGHRLAIRVDAIADVLRVAPSAVTPMGGMEGGLFDRWLVTDGPDARALPVLQVAALMERTPGVMPARERSDVPGSNAGAMQPAAALRRHTLAGLGSQVLAFDFAEVPDVQPMPPMRSFFAASGAIRGLVAWRGKDVPVVDLQRLLGVPGGVPESGRPLLMVLQHAERRIGVEVDALLGMEMVAADAIVPLGTGAILQPECYAGALRTARHGIASVLRVPALLAHPLVAGFLESHLDAASQASVQAAALQGGPQGAGGRTTFLVYRAGGGCATPLVDVEEILDYRAPAVRVDEAGGGMCGLVERRGRPLEVFDLRTLLGSPAVDASPQSCVLVVRRGERLRGFLVDSLVSLVAADATKQMGREPAEGARPSGSGLGRMLVVGQGADSMTCRQVDLRSFMGSDTTPPGQSPE